MEARAALFKTVVSPVPQRFRKKGIRTHISINLRTELCDKTEWSVPAHLSVGIVEDDKTTESKGFIVGSLCRAKCKCSSERSKCARCGNFLNFDMRMDSTA